jgi:hypothetical protein
LPEAAHNLRADRPPKLQATGDRDRPLSPYLKKRFV